MMSSNAPEIRLFNPGLGVHFHPDTFQFSYDDGVFGPEHAELRSLKEIRAGLQNPECNGPDPVYSIVMDVGRKADEQVLKQRMLLYGVVAYAAGRLGSELVRSQGHIHAVAAHCAWSTPEVVEVWEGRGIVYLQKNVADDPGICVAIEAVPGDVVVIPPGWAHFIANADPEHEMVFGAFCDRQYAFVYDSIRRRGGLAWFPQITNGPQIEWVSNPTYLKTSLQVRRARQYPELRIDPALPLYQQFVNDPERLQWVSEPSIYAKLWETFQP
jgi:glucose-6-phosphate isomerase